MGFLLSVSTGQQLKDNWVLHYQIHPISTRSSSTTNAAPEDFIPTEGFIPMENILPTEDFIPPRGFYPSPDDFLPKGTRGAHQEAVCFPLHPPKALESEEQGKKEIFLSSSATAAQSHAETDDRKQGLRNRPFNVKPLRITRSRVKTMEQLSCSSLRAPSTHLRGNSP